MNDRSPGDTIDPCVGEFIGDGLHRLGGKSGCQHRTPFGRETTHRPHDLVNSLSLSEHDFAEALSLSTAMIEGEIVGMLDIQDAARAGLDDRFIVNLAGLERCE